MSAGDIVLITGVMASGKSTVAEALARAASRSVHLRGDVFRRMIVNGRLDMSANADEAALAQLHLRYRLAADAALRYADDGFEVFYQDVIIGPVLGDVVRLFAGRRLDVFVLCPSTEAIAEREAGRDKVGYRQFGIAELDRVLRQETPRIGKWLDTSDLTIDETVAAIEATRARRSAAR